MRLALFFLFLGRFISETNSLQEVLESDFLRRTELVVEGFVDTEACYSAIELSVAHKEGDRRMDAESYVAVDSSVQLQHFGLSVSRKLRR
jgi:hypothetical protein